MQTCRDTLLAGAISALLVSMPSQIRSLEARESGPQVGASAQRSERLRYKIAIKSDAESPPRIILTNLYEQPLTACFLEMSSSSDSDSRKSKMMWDSYSQGQPPISKEDSLSLPLGHVVGRPFPDRVEVAAAVWADGSTTGSPDLLNLILASRMAQQNAYEWAISLLRTGLQQDWSRAMYLVELNREENKQFLHSLPGMSMKSTFEANPNMDTHQKPRLAVVQRLLAAFTQKRDELLQSTPESTKSTNTPIP